MIDDFQLEFLIEPLQDWFAGHARILPWREHPQPYEVWISEIMLQQTRVEAVKPYFQRFLEVLPDVNALAQCPDDVLMKLWEGLGYYNRARNLKIAAQQVMSEYQGRIPGNYEELLTLKGIGHYTAGAIASIAFGQPVPAVDGNVLRVISRVTADDSDIGKQSVRNHLEERLRKLMEIYAEPVGRPEGVYALQEEPGILDPCQFNQALMELGATVCLPNGAPLCEACPWKELCLARKQNRISELPVKKKAKARRVEEKTVLVIRDGDEVAIRKRPEKGLLAGLYELPNFEGKLDEDEVLLRLQELGLIALRIKPIGEEKHIFSHVEWQMSGYMVWVESQDRQKSPFLFVEAEDAQERYAVPAAFAKYAAYMNLRIGAEAYWEKNEDNG